MARAALHLRFNVHGQYFRWSETCNAVLLKQIDLYQRVNRAVTSETDNTEEQKVNRRVLKAYIEKLGQHM